jgi:hypothetical protein
MDSSPNDPSLTSANGSAPQTRRDWSVLPASHRRYPLNFVHYFLSQNLFVQLCERGVAAKNSFSFITIPLLHKAAAAIFQHKGNCIDWPTILWRIGDKHGTASNNF